MPDNPLLAYNFHVYINNKAYGFQKISNIEQVIETEMITEGGCDYVKILPSPPKNINIMRFTKGAGTFEEETFVFKVGQYINSPIHIFVLGQTEENGKIVRKPRKHYCILGAMISKWNLSDFDAESSTMLIETFEIQYSKLEQVPIKYNGTFRN